MYKRLAVIAGTLAILSGSLLVCDRAEAGASASAPSKPSRANQVAANQARSNQNYGITEFSSSSARSTSPKH